VDVPTRNSAPGALGPSQTASRPEMPALHPEVRTDWGLFAPEDVANMRSGLDRAWNAIPPESRTLENMDATAATVVRLATLGERDPVRLSMRALKVILREANPMERHDVEVLEDETTAALPSVEPEDRTMSEWPSTPSTAPRILNREMQKCVYDSDDLRLLSSALSRALELVRKSAGGPLFETETADFSRRITRNLLDVFDSGERNLEALTLAGLIGVLSGPQIRYISK
jgi:hypothetical protein